MVLTIVCSLLRSGGYAKSAELAPLALPGIHGEAGFDDINYSPALNKVLVPGGGSGKLFLVDPKHNSIKTISGFSTAASSGPGHGQGITSADSNGEIIVVTDRTSGMLDVLDAASGKMIASSALASGPDYVRLVHSTNEIWVTQPREQRIEFFSMDEAHRPSHAGFIAVEGGPESLLIDDSRGRAYTHLWKGTSLAIDLRTHEILSRWQNGCAGSRGIALDSGQGLLLTGCNEGKLTVVDVANGKEVGTASSGAGVDIIAYDPRLRRAYLPGADSATMAVVEISNAGAAAVVETVPTARDTHCVAADQEGRAWICDPEHGRLLYFRSGQP